MSADVKLRIEKLTMSFGGLTALDDVSLDISRGEIRGIIGPNGAGKTTLLNAITGVSPPTSGKLFLDGKPITGLKGSDIAARGMRRTFQSSQLFKGMTVLENVMTGLHGKLQTSIFDAAFSLQRVTREEREAAQRARAALEFVGMEQFADRDGGELSFGQQRIVEIARALVGDPEILLLDEHAVGLSLNRVIELEALLKKIREERGVTIIMIEHVIRVVMNVCDRVTVLASGRKIAEGTADEVAENRDVIEAYLGRGYNAVSAKS
ncbi:MAG: ABC transporter ATP-binding protein [Hyphomicrobiaceae bacterium]